MDLNPDSCWDCPVSFYGSVGYAAVALALLWIGLALRRHRLWIVRRLGAPILAISFLSEFVDVESIRRFTIEWPWMAPSLTPPNRTLDSLFIALLIAASAHLILRAPQRGSP